ncbi:hypothetical protein QM012_003580 [Aureobasidium pullulans]|uniref:DUF1917-domain-containing protein n=1 Tax=Aureobasidium pullulans TaxID=5580 RepID=A0ABR0T8T9_AURPU
MQLDPVPFAGYISDDSDFYGTPKARKKLEAHSKKTSTKQLVQNWYRGRAAHPTACFTMVSSNIVDQTPLYNRLEGLPTARQLNEIVDEFLKRLPPRTSITSDWIWISCPSHKEQMTDRACALMSQSAAEKERVISANPNSTQSTFTRKLSPLREQLKEDILDLAVAMWRIIAQAVVDGRLGDIAKVAPADPPDPDPFGAVQKQQASHLVCVYTTDFSDLDDVRRVLEELIELGLAPRAADGAIYYKTDAYTYLNIDSSNSYGLKASLYSSKDIIGLSKTARQPPPSKRKQQTLTIMLADSKKRKM